MVWRTASLAVVLKRTAATSFESDERCLLGAGGCTRGKEEMATASEFWLVEESPWDDESPGF
jgi:hypothetical protein